MKYAVRASDVRAGRFGDDRGTRRDHQMVPLCGPQTPGMEDDPPYREGPWLTLEECAGYSQRHLN